jgi:hypothetical protein
VIPGVARLPGNVREFGSHRCETFRLDDAGVSLHGHSFANRAVPEDLSSGYCPSDPGMVNIGVLHTSAEGADGHDTYAPCNAASLALRGYDYWALGHVHTRQTLHEGPWVVFPGNTQGRQIRETGPKGCVVVDIQDRHLSPPVFHALDVLRWAAAEVDVSGASLLEVEAKVAAAVEAEVEGAAGRPLALRLKLTGESDLHGRLAMQEAALADLAARVAIERGAQLWLESLRVRTVPRRQAIGDWQPLSLRFHAALGEPEVRTGLLREFQQVQGKLPEPARAEAGLPGEEELGALAHEAWALVQARLEDEA